MKKLITLLAVAAVLAVVFISGCTQQPPAAPSGSGGTGGTGGAIDKAAEDKAAAALESELDSAVANISSSDVESALLNQ